MNSRTALRHELRPQGELLSGCRDCVLFDRCQGIHRRQGQLYGNTCFAQHCCEEADCARVCPMNGHWESDLREHGNLRFDNLPTLTQRAAELPAYVPLIDHRIAALGVLGIPIAALKTSEVFKLRRGRYAPVADDADGLRAYFRLAPGTRLVLRGTDKDPPLERYWQNRLRARAPQAMARLGIDLVVGPNFSHRSTSSGPTRWPTAGAS